MTGDLCWIMTISTPSLPYTFGSLRLDLLYKDAMIYIHSRGVVIPSSPSSRPPTTGTRSLALKIPIFLRESDTTRRSTASCEMFAVLTTGCGAEVRRLVFNAPWFNTDNDQCLSG